MDRRCFGKIYDLHRANINAISDGLKVFFRCYSVNDSNVRKLVRTKVLSIFKPSFRRLIASGAQESSVGIFGGTEAVINRNTEGKKVAQTVRGALMPTKKTGKGRGRGSNTKKGQAKPAAGGSQKGKKKPHKRNNAKKGRAKATDTKAAEKKEAAAATDNSGPCKLQPGPDPDCQPLLGLFQGCGAWDDTRVSEIPRDANWPVSFPLQSAVEYVSATGLRPETEYYLYYSNFSC